MKPELQLTDTERALLLDLLESERRDLPSQIRRSDTTRFRKGLEERLHTVEGLVHRLRSETVESAYH